MLVSKTGNVGSNPTALAMKPYGIRNKFLGNFTHHYKPMPKGHVNWWENEGVVIKKRERQKTKKLIRIIIRSNYGAE